MQPSGDAPAVPEALVVVDAVVPLVGGVVSVEQPKATAMDKAAMVDA
ncbi:Hypothetical protein A7982_04388 [Minicystis rosea]|nr:Hypothetical protein A7982_04388 [Minicystis rosea]